MRSGRWLAAVLGVGGAVVLGGVVVALRGGGLVGTVDVVDNRSGIAELLEERACGEAGGVGTGGTFPELTPEEARLFFPALARDKLYDGWMLSRSQPNFVRWQRFPEYPGGRYVVRTNSLGMREDGDPAAERPDLRVLVVGDSHVDGVCPNPESFPNVLESMLADRHRDRTIEVLNGGTGGWSFYNYLGALEGWKDLRPHVFVVTVYGGNDFSSALDLWYLATRTERPPTPGHGSRVRALAKLAEVEPGIPAQCWGQVVCFADAPALEEAANRMAREVTDRIAATCRQRGIRLLMVYLPPWMDAQPELAAPAVEAAREIVGLSREAEEVSQRLADRWIEHCRASGIEVVDLRPAFREREEPLYWRADHHLSVAGQRAAAEALLPVVERLAGLVRAPAAAATAAPAAAAAAAADR